MRTEWAWVAESCDTCVAPAAWNWERPFLARELAEHVLGHLMKPLFPNDTTPMPPGTYEVSP